MINLPYTGVTRYIVLVVSTLLINISAGAEERTFIDALIQGDAYIDARLRYESVEEDKQLDDADALTLRTRLGYETGGFYGFSALLELEDSREVFGVDDFSVPPSDIRTGQFSVIADPENTELDQGYIAYSNKGINSRLGRQVITHDGQRFIGDVGWRQDRQTFDAFSLGYQSNDHFAISASYIDKRNRIFADDADIESKDFIINAWLQTAIGKWVGYAYLLEADDNDIDDQLDTYGISYSGNKEQLFYRLEYAQQEADDVFDTDYLAAEGGINFGSVTTKIGYELLGSDNGEAGFSTPLATLHKFNGWADMFLNTPAAGLQDWYISSGGNLLEGKWLAVYHDFSADDSIDGDDDLGNELDLQFTRDFAKHYKFGIKYADYSSGDSTFEKVDTEKFWIWLEAKF